MFKPLLFFLLLSLILVQNIQAQYSSKKVRNVHEVYTDSLRQIKYDYTFPIWGQKVYKRGFDIPYPAGVMVNTMWMKQGILIDNLQLGLMTDNLDIPLTGVDFVEFGENTSSVLTTVVRPDLWIFPFLNVYGIFGFGSSHTEVILEAPIELKSVVDQNVKTAGLGVTGAGGVGPIWIAVDANITWSKPELLEKAVKVSTTGIRFGQSFTFKNKPYRNIAPWVGAMWASLSSSTIGELALRDALPDEVWDARDDLVNDYWNWYNSLNPLNPFDKVKLDKADQILTPIVEQLDAADGSAIIRYGLDKQVEEKWNGVLGIQYQHNKRWIFRSEAGLIGNRKSFMLSVNHRFLL